jgi:hypothetical protein
MDTLLNNDGLLCWRFDTARPMSDTEAIYARPFGRETGDLDVDFSADARPVLISQVLHLCLRHADGQHLAEDNILGWTLTRRLQGLLAIVVATRGRSALLPVRCPRASCLEKMELELDLVAFRHHGEKEFSACMPDCDTNLQIRLPTGYDQMNWLHSTPRDSRQLPVCMATTIVTHVNGSPPEEGWLVPESWLESVASALREHDPFTAMAIEAECPNCGHSASYDIDIEACLLSTLSAVRQSLIDEVHRLASAYHWSEEEIISLSPRRRRYYLGRILEGALS